MLEAVQFVGAGSKLQWVLDSNGGLVWVCGCVELFFGESQEQLLRAGVDRLIHCDDWQQVAETMAPLIAGDVGKVFGRNRQLGADGQWYSVGWCLIREGDEIHGGGLILSVSA